MAKIEMPLPMGATSPSPADDAAGVALSAVLSWEPGGYSVIEAIPTLAKVTLDETVLKTVDFAVAYAFEGTHQVQGPALETVATAAVETMDETLDKIADITTAVTTSVR